MKRSYGRGGRIEETPTEQENRVASALGGRRIGGSGASMYAKGDAITDRYLIECKQTEKASISIQKKWLDKIAYEAAGAGRQPILAIEIKGESSGCSGQDIAARAHGERDWVCMPLRIFLELVLKG